MWIVSLEVNGRLTMSIHHSPTNLIQEDIQTDRTFNSLTKSSINNRSWITITEQSATDMILDSVGDYDTKRIINSVLAKSLVIADILKMCKIPQTSGYRKINFLIRNGLLVKHGYIITKAGKKVERYTSPFEKMQIAICDGKVTVRAKLSVRSRLHLS